MRDKIRRFLGKDIPEIIKEYEDKDINDKYEGLYIGRVISNNDPDRLGRCQIRVFGVFSNEIPNNDLPWASPDFGFIGSLKGSFIVPPVNTVVNVYFDRGDIYLPRYTTKVIDQNNLPTDKDTNYPNMMVFYETDNGDKFTLDRSNGNTTLTHRTGATVMIDNLGNVEVSPASGKTMKINTNTVLPDLTNFGPFNCIPNCLFTGAIHQGNTSTKTS